MSLDFTKEQISAVNTCGNLLVSAAAGSGKTAVLVERVIRMLKDSQNPISADRLLIVTFTNAAAAEMRARIEKRLYEEILNNPLDLALKKQKYLISSAKICTIDSFCIDLVRENFHKLSVNPDFKISTPENLEALSKDTANAVVFEQMEKAAPEFFKLLELTGCEYDESKLVSTIREIFNYSMVTPFPDSFLEKLVLCYKGDFNAENTAYNKAVETAIRRTGNMRALAETGLCAAKRLGEEAEKAIDYFEAYLDITENLLSVAKEGNWDSILNSIKGFIMPPVPIGRGFSSFEEVTVMREIREAVLAERDGIMRIFKAEREEIDRQNKQMYPAVSLLIELVRSYSDRLFKVQLEENSLTFYNTEQLALKLLCSEDSDGNIILNEGAQEIFSQFDEVLVDEYQDVNDLQDMLFYLLSNKGKNLFAVGDVKQSIYGFRGANPNIFLEKKNKSTNINLCDDGSLEKKVVLSSNFRSRKEICDYINFFFENVMTAENTDIEYGAEERLVAGNKDFKDTEIPVNRLCLIDNIADSEDDRITIESNAIAEQIRKIMESGECIHTKDGGLRKAVYSDFAILLRATSENAPKIAAALELQGIPVNCANDDFTESLEVDTFLSLLKIIDNPADDIALLTVLMSPMFGFTAEELAVLRANHPNGDFISAVSLSKDENERISDFYKALEHYRAQAAVLPLETFIFKLINITGYGDIVSAMPDGIRRHANLLKLSRYAAAYSESYGNSIGGFVKYVKKTAAGRLSSAKVSSGADAVQIMSIHASKGLQFPVTVIANIDSRINMSDSSDSMLFSEKIGLGFRYFDEDSKTRTDSIVRTLISEEMRIKTLHEELRLLYVAMTRAEDILILVGAYKNLKKRLFDASVKLLADGGKIGRRAYEWAGALGDWVLMTAILHPDGEKLRIYGETSKYFEKTDSKMEIEIIDAKGIKKRSLCAADDLQICANKDIAAEILKNMSYKYPFDGLREIEAKYSASSLNKSLEDKYAFESQPSFTQKDGLTGADRGTAMHKVMQFIDFDARDVESEIERLREWEYLSDYEADAVDVVALKRFFDSDIFKRIKASNEYHREMRFLTEVSAGSINSNLNSPLDEEKVIIQGAVDLCFVEGDGIVVLDFKSDRVDNPEELKRAYSRQLSIYETAVEKIFSKPVKEKIIYSFPLGAEIKI